MTTNVPLPRFTDTGLQVPTEPAILSGVLADMQDAFAQSGRTLNSGLTTPQGQLAQSEAYMLSQLYGGFLQLINAVDPATTSGAFQDALARIYFLTRQPATYATVSAVVSGVAGTVLEAGAQARSADGTIWSTIAPVTFGANGSASALFRAASPGAGPAVGVNGLTIYQQRSGWEAVANEAPSTPGVNLESRQSFEERRAASVNIGGTGTAEAVRAAVANVPGVTDVYVYNNGSDAAITYGTTAYPIRAHSIAVTASGGSDSAVAAAIHSKLDAGCGLPMSAGVGELITVSIEDSVNYTQPYPQYLIRFVRPAPVTIYARVEVANLSTLPSTYVSDVQRALAAAVTDGFVTSDGSISVSRARIGGQIVAAEYFAAILSLSNITPISINIGLTPNPTNGPALTLGIDQLPVTSALDVNVVVVDV